MAAYPGVPTAGESSTDANGNSVVGVARGSLFVWERVQSDGLPAGSSGQALYHNGTSWVGQNVAEFIFDAPRKVHDVTASGAAVAWSLSEGAILELQNVNANVTVTVTDDRVGGTNNRLELNEVAVVATQDATGGRTVTMAGDFPAGAVTLQPTQSGQTGSGASETGIASWVRARSTGTAANDWVSTVSDSTSSGEFTSLAQIGGASFAWDLSGDGLARYAQLSLDQDMTIDTSNIALGQYGSAEFTQTTGGHRPVSGTNTEVVGKTDQSPGAVTNFELKITAGTTAQLISTLTPKEGLNALGNASALTAINFEHGTSDNKSITLDGNLAVPVSAQRAGDYKLIVTQDATGSRTIDWATLGVTYYGVAPQPNPAASSSTTYTLTYDGTNWTV